MMIDGTMVDVVKRPPQPVRAMVLALFMLPISLLELIRAGTTLIPWQTALYLSLGILTFLAAMLIIVNRLLGRWIAVALGVYGVFVGMFIVSVVLGFRFEAPLPLLADTFWFGLIVVAFYVLWIWMAFPLPSEQAAHRAARASRRAARAARRDARNAPPDPSGST